MGVSGRLSAAVTAKIQQCQKPCDPRLKLNTEFIP